MSSDGSKVTLRKANGEVIVVEVSRLSTASQNFLKRAAEFVKDYNKFYQELSILKETDEEKRAFRIDLSAQVAQIIKSGMGILGIEVPERM